MQTKQIQKFFKFLPILTLLPFFARGQCTLTGSTIIPGGTYDVSSSPTYFSVGSSTGSLVINASTTVHITNTTHIQTNFQNGATITVQAGAALYLDGVNFTSCGSGTWQGILVLGTQSLSQTTSGISALNLAHQGLLVTTDGVQISNAQIGIEVGESAHNVFDGGIVRCAATTFTDCWSGVTFDPYANPNWSYFYDCTFSWDKILDSAIESFRDMALVKLNHVQGVFFAGANTFSNTTPYSDIPVYYGYSHDTNPTTHAYWLQDSDRGQGIFADNSSFFMKCAGPCYIKDNNATNCIFCLGTQNVFQYLSFGIRSDPLDYESLTTASDGEIMVSGCKFKDCEYGIFLNYVPEVFISRNLFKMDDSMDTYFHYADMHGVTVINSSYLSGYGYTTTSALPETMEISDNTFNYLTTYDPSGCNANPCGRKEAYVNGITCAATMAHGGEQSIYHNFFNMKYCGINCGTYMNGIELFYDNTELQIQCNAFDLDPSGSITDCDSTPSPHIETCADIFINLDFFGDLQSPQAIGNADAGNQFSQDYGNPTAYGITNTDGVLYNIMFNIEEVQPLGSHVSTYNGGTLDYYYNAGTPSKQPVFNYDPYSFLSVHTTSTINNCTESSYCSFFNTANFDEDEYTAMTGADDPTIPNNDLEEPLDDWKTVLGPVAPESTSNDSNRLSDAVTAQFYSGINSFTYNVKSPYSSGQLVITDMIGHIVKTCTLSGQTGAIPISLPGNNSYAYSIIIDGQRAKTGVFFVPAN